MYKILLVDDDKALRFVYSRYKAWHECGFEIAAEAGNGRQALEILEQEQFDLLMTDIRMPFVDGISLLKEIKSRKIEIFTILVSSYNEFEYARQGLILGASDFVVKPMTEQTLSEVLERAAIYLGEHVQNREYYRIIIAELGKHNPEAEGNAFLKRLSVYLSENMEQNITMDSVADSMKLNKDYFGKLFKQHAKTGFHSFYITIKMEYAKKLIADGIYKNYEISERLGFSTPDYFTKVFKGVMGITPSQYKLSLVK